MEWIVLLVLVFVVLLILLPGGRSRKTSNTRRSEGKGPSQASATRVRPRTRVAGHSARHRLGEKILCQVCGEKYHYSRFNRCIDCMNMSLAESGRQRAMRLEESRKSNTVRRAVRRPSRTDAVPPLAELEDTEREFEWTLEQAENDGGWEYVYNEDEDEWEHPNEEED